MSQPVMRWSPERRDWMRVGAAVSMLLLACEAESVGLSPASEVSDAAGPSDAGEGTFESWTYSLGMVGGCFSQLFICLQATDRCLVLELFDASECAEPGTPVRAHGGVVDPDCSFDDGLFDEPNPELEFSGSGSFEGDVFVLDGVLVEQGDPTPIDVELIRGSCGPP